MDSDCEQPLNLGSDEMIDMNDFAALALSFEGEERRPGVLGRTSTDLAQS